MSGVHLRFGQLYGWGPLALEHAVDEDAVLAVAHEIEVGMVEEDLEVPARYEARMAHVHVHVAPRTVAPDHDPVLADHVLELAALEARDHVALGVRRPRHQLRGAGRCRLEGQQGPRVALGRARVRGHRWWLGDAATPWGT